MKTTESRFYGIGVGPGDPELITLKACRIIAKVDVLAFLVNEAGESQAKTIASQAIDMANKSHQYLPIFMPMREDRFQANTAYDKASEAIINCLKEGLSVAFLCEGDPLFYGSCIYLMQRMATVADRCQIIPGISAVHAASAALQTPLTQQAEGLAVISGRVSDKKILLTLSAFDAVVILKAGVNRARLMQLIEQSGRADQTQYIEYISRDQEKSVTDFDQLSRETGPYFSLFLITRNKGFS